MPTSSQIANLIIDKELDIKALNLILSKYKAESLMPIIIKKLKHRISLINPENILETATELDQETLSQIENKIYGDSANLKVRVNPSLLAGFVAIRGYKSIDASARRIVNKIRN